MKKTGVINSTKRHIAFKQIYINLFNLRENKEWNYMLWFYTRVISWTTSLAMCLDLLELRHQCNRLFIAISACLTKPAWDMTKFICLYMHNCCVPIPITENNRQNVCISKHYRSMHLSLSCLLSNIQSESPTGIKR